MDTAQQLAPLEDACTIVLLRDGAAGLETLMLERPGNSRSFGGAWVFPGGKVDPGDRVNPAGEQLDEFAAAQAAGLRELAEETGQQLSPKELVWLSQWTPMQRIPRRFRTWFMLGAATTDQVVLNPEEHERSSWLPAREALALHTAGKMILVPPTWVTLHNLLGLESTEQAVEQSRKATPFIYNTHLLTPSNGEAASTLAGFGAGAAAGVLWDGDEEYPESKAPAGARHRLTMTDLPWVFTHAHGTS
ncbi:NUDIX hydrolase [Arthrobacter sp. TMP15]|uniref:NUDIX hydrolase n=1 Tax=Arthrobacter sp. TMP15 TaxID=3140789 RepID=UPI0031B9FDF8